MTEGMPQLIAAEIDSYDQVLQRAIKAEQELAAAEAALDGRRLAAFADYLSDQCRASMGPIAAIREYLTWVRS